jgi:hypothetical protein
MSTVRKILLGVLAALAAVALVLVGFKAERLAARALHYERFVRRIGGVQHRVRIGGFDGIVILPRGRKLDADASWVWYAPAVWGGYPGEDNEWLFRNLLSKGISVAGIDVGDSYGNVKGRKAYSEFYEAIVAKYGLSRQPCLLGQSRGGLMLYSWAEDNAGEVGCIAGIFPVTDLQSWPGLEDKKLQAAYGMTEAELRAGLAGINPIDRLGALAARGVPVFHVHGDADKVAPLLQNTFEFARRYNEAGGRAEFSVVHSKAHEASPEFFQSEQLLVFLLSTGSSIAGRSPAIAYSPGDKISLCAWENSHWAPRPPCKICFETCSLPAPGTITKIEYRCEGDGCANSQNPMPGGGAGPLVAFSSDRRSFTWARRWSGTAPIKDIYTIYFAPDAAK